MAVRHTALLAALLVAASSLGAPASAGTTGSLAGVVTSGGQPVSGAQITAVSPSQRAEARTDGGGHFAFASLAPDTYALTVERAGYQTIQYGGVTVQADAQQTLTFTMQRALQQIGAVRARSSSDLVRPGTTADVYSVSAAQQDAVSALGGGGNLNSAYSAVASVPGAYVPANQSGYNQAIHIRGGDSDQVGFEFDGIPVNRGFDNYPSGSLSSLGQQELQVYTGASPANTEAQGLAGFINQVIKTGTYPGSVSGDLGLGGPAYYHGVNFEAGGSDQSRLFSYYVGLGGYNQNHRYIDQYNGASYGPEFGPVLAPCAANTPPTSAPPPTNPSCFTNGVANVSAYQQPGYILGPPAFASIQNADVDTRTSVVNLHFGIPHKDGNGKDDIQLLYDVDEIYSSIYSSAYDEGLNLLDGQVPQYSDSWQYTGKLGAFLPSNYEDLVQPYMFPSSPNGRSYGASIPLAARDVGLNGQAIVKLQYQKNFGTSAFLRVYGYTYYSDYIDTGADSSWQGYTGYDSGDYEVNSHTRGVSATFADQINAKNFLQLQASYTTSRSERIYNEQPFGYADNFAVLVNPNDLSSGTCYSGTGSGAATPTTCTGSPTFAALSGIGCAKYGFTQAGCAYAAGPPLPANSMTCGGVPCAYYVVENGAYGELNAVRPTFTGYSITDDFRPTDKLLFTAGLRLDNYQFAGDNTTGTAARAFWFNAYNKDTCYNSQTGQIVDKSALGTAGIAVASPCSSAGAQYATVDLTNVPSQQFNYAIVQPRLGMTYTIDADNVLRASYGKYNEQPSAAYEQYDALQQNLAAELATEFYAYGFNTPGHAVRPSVSYNSDFSFEHHFKGTDMSLKFSPFYRKTQDQVENFYLNYRADFFSGLNVGAQTSQGFELALDKGDFSRNGLAGMLSFAYTNSYVKYGLLSNGTTVVTPINDDIQTYNAYTSFCASHPTDKRCGSTTNGLTTAACYTPAGTPDPGCAGGDIANPYWNAPVQPLLDPNANYVPYSVFPAGIGTGVNGFDYPYVATLILNYKHDRLQITPSLQFQAGNRYGAPETTPGIDPASAGCLIAGTGSTAGDPRYPYGAAGGAPYSVVNCGAAIAAGGSVPGLNAIPDPYTGQFDGIGAFREPSQILANLRISYDLSKRATLVVTLANVINHCFGGQQTKFTYYSTPQVCSYGGLTNALAPVGNQYDPGDNIQPFQRYPYEPAFGSYNDLANSTLQPFAVYVSLRLKL